MKSAFVTLAVTAIVVLAVWAVREKPWQRSENPTAGAPSATPSASSDPAKRGEELYYEHCSVCHSADTDEAIVGPSLKGFFQTPPAPLADGTELPRTDTAVRELFEKGTMNMPPTKGLSPQQLENIIAFLHTL